MDRNLHPEGQLTHNKLLTVSVCHDFIDQYEGVQQELLTYLDELISSFPEVTCRLRYQLPFYYRKSWICYLNPNQDGKVELAFTRGNELSNEQGLLASRGRKQVYSAMFSSILDVDENELLEVLQEAFVLDAEVPYASKRKGK